jgi:hypothetical protein
VERGEGGGVGEGGGGEGEVHGFMGVSATVGPLVQANGFDAA